MNLSKSFTIRNYCLHYLYYYFSSIPLLLACFLIYSVSKSLHLSRESTSFHLSNGVNAMSFTEINQLREKTREMFFHAFNGYMDNAFPDDELKPLSCTPLKRSSESKANVNWAVNDVLGDYFLTLVDSLDTLAIMNEKDLFHQSIRKVIHHLHDFNLNSRIQVFEVTIRMLGGLLSSHLLASDPQSPVYMPDYNDELLFLAKDLGDRLLPAFTSSPTGLPSPRVNLIFGVLPWESNSTCTACVGTLILEFGTLSRLLNDSKYENYARTVLNKLWSMRSKDNLFGSYMDISGGKWTNMDATIGAGSDSFYEYLMKGYALFGDQELQQMFMTSYNAILTHLRHGDSYLYKTVHTTTKVPVNTDIEALSAFWPGVQVLFGDVNRAISHHQFLFTIWRKYGAFPERFNYATKMTTVSSYPLRPELIESTYLLYRATQNPYYLEVGASMLRDIENRMKTKCGFATVEDVNTGTLGDRMESFFLAETLKYFYLLFDSENYVHSGQNQFVFTTEGHLLSLDRSKLNSRTFNSKDIFKLKCTNVRKTILFKHGYFQKEMFDQSEPAYLPLPLYMIEDMYQTVDLNIKGDWFYQTVILPLYQGSYFPQRIDRDICDARFHLGRHIITIDGDIPKNRTTIKMETGLFISTLQGARVSLQDFHFNKQNFYRIESIDQYPVGSHGIVLLPRSAFKNPSKEGKTNKKIFDLEPVNYFVNMMFLEDPHSTVFVGYVAQFGPVLRVAESVTSEIVPLLDETTGQLKTGCEILNAQEEKLAFGNILMVKRGECNFVVKALHAMWAKSVALIIVNDQPVAFTMAFQENDQNEEIRIPSIMVPSTSGEMILKYYRHEKNENGTNRRFMFRIFGSGGMKASSAMINLAERPVMNAFLVESENPRLPFWKKRTKSRGSRVLDVGQDLSCLIRCTLRGDQQSCHQTFVKI